MSIITVLTTVTPLNFSLFDEEYKKEAECLKCKSKQEPLYLLPLDELDNVDTAFLCGKCIHEVDLRPCLAGKEFKRLGGVMYR